MARSDLPLLVRWLETPHVARWWAHETTPAAIEADFGDGIDGREPTDYDIALHEGRPIGLIQRYPMAAYPEYPQELSVLADVPAGAWSIDYFIGEPDAVGRGLACAMTRACVESIWRDDREASAVVTAVHADNPASWRMLERAGFVRVASGELEPDNPVDDRRHFMYRIDRP